MHLATNNYVGMVVQNHAVTKKHLKLKEEKEAYLSQAVYFSSCQNLILACLKALGFLLRIAEGSCSSKT